jgi:uncharacterized membrane protein
MLNLLLMGEQVNKQDYINQLRKELNGLMQSDIDDIIRDQEEYFREAASSGRNEASVISSLGEPAALAKELKAEYQIKVAASESKIPAQAKGIFNAILALCVLAPFNLIFVLGPFIAICSTLFSFWLVDAVFGVLAVAGILVSLAVIIMMNPLLGLTGVFASIAVLGLSLLAFCIIYYVTVGFMKVMVSFLKWNINFVTGAAK